MSAIQILLTVHYDAVKVETDDHGRVKTVGWFRDEVCAVSAALERLMMFSSSFAKSRKLPPIEIRSDYRADWLNKKIPDYKRATKVKPGPDGRRIVRVPGTFTKRWVL